MVSSLVQAVVRRLGKRGLKDSQALSMIPLPVKGPRALMPETTPSVAGSAERDRVGRCTEILILDRVFLSTAESEQFEVLIVGKWLVDSGRARSPALLLATDPYSRVTPRRSLCSKILVN